MDNIATKKVYRHGQHRERLSSAFDTETAKSLGLNTREVLPKKIWPRKKSDHDDSSALSRLNDGGKVITHPGGAEHRLAMTQPSKV